MYSTMCNLLQVQYLQACVCCICVCVFIGGGGVSHESRSGDNLPESCSEMRGWKDGGAEGQKEKVKEK